MIAIVPGADYFFRGGANNLREQLNKIDKWMDEHDMGERVSSDGDLVFNRTYYFMSEEDALAFKLTLGI